MNLLTSSELAPSQIPEWYAYQLQPDSPVYNISFNHFFLEKIDVELFICAWQAIIDRHQAFHIRFAYQNGKPLQYADCDIVLTKENTLIDRTSLPLDALLAEQNKLAKHYALLPFNFEKGPLFRLHLVAFPEASYQLIFTVHHIIWDETSTMNFIQEFIELYEAGLQKRQPNLPQLKKNYLNYAEEVNHALLTGLYDKHKDYWLNLFKTLPTPLLLPTDFSRPAMQTYNGNTIIHWLKKDLIRKIEDYLAQQNITLFTFLLAVLNLYFYRITNQDDIVLGCPIAGRDAPDYKHLIGCFAVPMPIRCQIKADMTFQDLIHHIANRVLDALEHYHYPCTQLIEKLNHTKDLSRPKLFSIMAGMQNNKSEFMDITLGEGRLYAKEIYSAENHGARFDLAIGLDPIGSDIKFFCTYNTDLFHQATVERLLESLSSLFEETITTPHLPLSDYSLLNSAQTQKILHDFNKTHEPHRNDVSLVELFETQCLKTPEHIAVTQSENSLSYAELNHQVNQLAHYLKSNGLTSNTPIGVLLEPGFKMLISILAILKLGSHYVPIGPETPLPRIQDIISSCQLHVIISSTEIGLQQSINAQFFLLDKLATELNQHSTNNLSIKTTPHTLSYILFTSGSTGKPKGIPIAQAGVVNLLHSTQTCYQLNSTDRLLFLTPFTFDASILDLFWPISYGATLVIPPKHLEKNPDDIIELIVNEKITIFQTVPSFLNALCDVKKVDTPYLKHIICGAEAMSRLLRDKALSSFSCNLYNHYGPTEITVDATRFNCAEDFEGETVPLGKPITNTSVYVLDDYLQPLPIGIPGEIYIASPGLTPGYLNDPQKTEQQFIKKGKTILYKTGDLGKFDEQGVLYFCARKDNQIKINGHRIEIEEIETTLNQCPHVTKAVVRQYKFNDQQPRLVAIIEANSTWVNKMTTKDKSCYTQMTLANQPNLLHQMTSIHLETWPLYFEGSPYLAKYWQRVYAEYPSYQFCLLDHHNNVAAVANGIPLYWDGSAENAPKGWDKGLEMAFEQTKKGIKPNTILGLAGLVSKQFQGKGLSNLIVHGFRSLAKMHGLDQFLGPVRPVGMFENNVHDLEHWAKLCDDNQEPVDYWLRVHKRIGATVLNTAPQSQLVEGTLQQWEQWTQEKWEKSGTYYTQETLQPIHVNVEKNWASYYDPSIWVGHYDLQKAPGISSPIELNQLRHFLLDKLPAYMVPDQYYLIAKLPLTTSGKLDESRLPKIEQPELTHSKPPETKLQIELANDWQSILQLSTIGIEDDFFVVGGQSLQVIHLLSIIQKKYAIKIPLQTFYRSPTIKSLETFIQQHTQELTCPVT